jgi:four helix bundle protein
MNTSYRESEAWKLSRNLNKEIHQILQHPSLSQQFRLKEQIRSSAGSIMDNIAEGFERDGRAELIQFLSIAKGSAGELGSQITRLFDMQTISNEQYQKSFLDGRLNFTPIGGIYEISQTKRV